MNQFDICALLFGGYARLIPLDKMVFYGYWKALPSHSVSMLHIALILFPFLSGLVVVFLINISIIIIAFSATFVYIIALVAETVLFP